MKFEGIQPTNKSARVMMLFCTDMVLLQPFRPLTWVDEMLTCRSMKEFIQQNKSARPLALLCTGILQLL